VLAGYPENPDILTGYLSGYYFFGNPLDIQVISLALDLKIMISAHIISGQHFHFKQNILNPCLDINMRGVYI